MFSKLKKLFESFISIESFSGVLLLVCSGVALFMANSSQWSVFYETINHFPLSFNLGSFSFRSNLHEIVNEVLMSFFFFVVGMEVKRELSEGELSSPKKAALPLIAALGGSLIPAGIYYLFNHSTPSQVGWGIPMATDIAFALGVLSLMSRKVPFSLKIFLLSLAIIDDILAVLVIALFYSQSISGPFLSLALMVCFAIFIYFKLRLQNGLLLAILSVALWACIYNSGIHSTLSGVILGLLIPYQTHFTGKQAIDAMSKAFSKGAKPTLKKVKQLGNMVKSTKSYLQHLIDLFHPYVSYFIIPLFAFSNAGVNIQNIDVASWIQHPASYGIILGLVLGKPLGIVVFPFVASLLKWVELPDAVQWKHIVAVGFLGGIGFTMSLFITNLSFTPFSQLHSFSKISVLGASVLAGVVGLVILAFSKDVPKVHRKKPK